MLLHHLQHTHQLSTLVITTTDLCYEGMLQQLTSWLTVSRVLTQTTTHEIFQLFTTRSKNRRLSIHYSLHRVLMLHSQKRRLSLYQFNSHHPQRPNVHFFVIWLLFNELRSHPRRRPHQRLPIHNFLGQLNGKSKIGQFHLSLHTQ